MKRFLHGHATHPDPHLALALAAAQIEAQRRLPGSASAPTLGWMYLTEPYTPRLDALLAELRQRWSGVHWVGATGIGIAASGVEYMDEPALALLLAEVPREQFRVFSGAQPLGDFSAHAANVHADPSTGDLADLIHDMSQRTASGYLFGGLASARSRAVHIADGAWTGGLSGVAFGPGVRLVSRVTQGCTPVGAQREVTAAERNVVTRLDDEPALDCLLRDLKLEGREPRQALPTLRQVLVGLSDGTGDVSGYVSGDGTGDGFGDRTSDAIDESRGDGKGRTATRRPADASSASAGSFDSGIAAISRRGAFGTEVRVRHLIGLDPGRRGIAIADHAAPGMRLAFCIRNAEAARRDLVRICAEVREEVEPDALTLPAALARKGTGSPTDPDTRGPGDGIAGAIYVSCSGRGGAHFGGPSAELAIIRHALGDVPLVGFFAAGEIARANLYGYTGVLTVFPT